MRIKLITVVLLALVASCGDRETNPIGQELVERQQGNLVALPPLSLAESRVKFDGVYPSSTGLESELFVGRMSGLILRTLLRFRIPADSLARAAGASQPGDLTVTNVRIELWRRSSFERLNGSMEVRQPDMVWDDFTTFADTVDAVELGVPSSPLAGASVGAEGDSVYAITLPPEYVQSSVAADPDSADVEILLTPALGEEFLAAMISREDLGPNSQVTQPALVLSYIVSDVQHTFETASSADAYWVARDEAGMPPDVLVMSSVVRLIPLLKYGMPDGIPAGATVVSTKLIATIDSDRSFFSSFPFGVDRIDIQPTTGDTVETRFNTWLLEGTNTTFELNQALVQGWLVGDVPNEGMLLKPRILTVMEWVTLRNPTLNVVYALPPGRLGQ
jgi:hypothetical protein